MTDLVTIQQAARMLNVSEATLRRWTNEGRLECVRVGERRTRRFRLEDLKAVIEGEGPPARRAFNEHRHLCGLYTSEESVIRLAADFLAVGLRSVETESVLLMRAADAAAVVARLDGLGLPGSDAVATGRLVSTTYADTISAQLALIERLFDAALARGARRVRGVGDVTGGMDGRVTSQQVCDYERAAEALLARYPSDVLCLYDARSMPGTDVVQVLACHEDVLSQRAETVLG